MVKLLCSAYPVTGFSLSAWGSWGSVSAVTLKKNNSFSEINTSHAQPLIRPINLQLPCLLCYPAVLLALWDPGPLAVLENPDDKNAISGCKCITTGAQSSSANLTGQHIDSD